VIAAGAQFFAAGGRQLFGVFNPARGRADAAVLLCPPMLHEQVRSHRLWALLADALAAQGISTWRFDYAGSGDAEGDNRLLDIAEAVIDAEYALAALRAATPALPVHVLGVRLGGFVAAELARRESLPLWLWQPFERGEQAWSELQARDLEERRSTRRFPFLRPGQTRAVSEPSVMGFALSERFGERLCAARSPFDAIQAKVIDADLESDRRHPHRVDLRLPEALSDWAGWIDISGPFPLAEVAQVAARLATALRGRS